MCVPARNHGPFPSLSNKATWFSECPQSLETQLLIQQIVQINKNKENTFLALCDSLHKCPVSWKVSLYLTFPYHMFPYHDMIIKFWCAHRFDCGFVCHRITGMDFMSSTTALKWLCLHCFACKMPPIDAHIWKCFLYHCRGLPCIVHVLDILLWWNLAWATLTSHGNGHSEKLICYSGCHLSWWTHALSLHSGHRNEKLSTMLSNWY